jgi:hypothetical protein
VIKHIVCFSFKADTSAADVQATLDALDALPGQIAWVRNWSLGKNTSTRDTTYGYALHCDFADETELQNYLTHPAHEQVARERLAKHWGSRAIVDYEFA